MSECTRRIAVGGNFYVNDLAETREGREGSQSEHFTILLLATSVYCELKSKSKWLMGLGGVGPRAGSPGHNSSIGSASCRI